MSQEITRILIMADDHIYHQQRIDEVKTRFNIDVDLNPSRTFHIISHMNPDLVFHLGDIYNLDAYKKITSLLGPKLFYIQGNHDEALVHNIPPSLTITLTSSNGHLDFFFNHCTKYWTAVDKEFTTHNFEFDQFKKDFDNDFDVLLCGHSHHQKIVSGPFLVLNPGSTNLAKMYSDYPLVGNFMMLNWNRQDMYKSTLDLYSIFAPNDEFKLTKTYNLFDLKK